MAIYTAVEVAEFWIGAGGPRSRMTEWTAVADEESGFNSDIISPTGAIGLWQFEPYTAAGLGYSSADMHDPRLNARAAVRLSGGGTNCAAWDSCYADIYRSGRYSNLPFPEVGSNVYNALPRIAAALGTHKIGGAAPPVPPISTDPAGPALAKINLILRQMTHGEQRRLTRQLMIINRQWRRGWR